MSDFETEDFSVDSAGFYDEPEPQVETEPEPEPSSVRVKYVLPGSFVNDDGTVFVFNRWVGVSRDEADRLLSLEKSGRPRFVSSDN